MNRKYPILIIILLSIRGLCANGQSPVFSSTISSTRVSTFIEDKDGIIWIGTNHGLNKYNGTDFLVYYSKMSEGDLNSDNILDMVLGEDNTIWIADFNGITYFKDGHFFNSTRSAFNPIERVLELDKDHIISSGRNGLVKFVKETWEFKSLYFEPGISWTRNIVVTPLKEIWAVCDISGQKRIVILDKDLQHLQDINIDGVGQILGMTCSDNQVWLSTDNGLLFFDIASKTMNEGKDELKSLTRGKKVLFTVPYDEGRILIGLSGNCMSVYDMNTDNARPLESNLTLNGDSYVCMVDSKSNIWLSDGINEPRFIPGQQQCQHMDPAVTENNNFKQMVFDKDGILWLGTDNAVYSYDTSSDRTIWSHKKSTPYENYLVDKGNRLWIIDDRNNLECYNLSKGHPERIMRYAFDNEISSLCEGTDGSIWAFGNFKVYIIKDGNMREISSLTPLLTYGHCDSVSGTIYVNDVLGNIYTYDLQTDDFIQKDFGGIENIISFITASDGTVWLSTFRNGIFHIFPESGKTLHYDISNGLMENNIKSMLEDRDGNIWVSTNRHISKYDIREDRFTTFYDIAYSDNDVYEYGSACISPYGDILFGGASGITSIRGTTSFPYKNEDIKIIPEFAVIDGRTVVNIQNGIEMFPQDNSLTIHYSGISYGSGASLSYAIMLEGYDKDWRYTNEKIAYYSNLKPGEYTFRAQVRLMNGEWSDNRIEIPVHLRHSLWNSLPFKATCLLLFLGLMWGFIRMYLKWRLQSERLEIAERSREIAANHLDFLANVSHEIRTPLSLIYGPLTNLKQDQGLSPSSRNLLEIIGRNADRLKDLSDKMMSHHEDNDSTLHVVKEDISQLINDIVSLFMVTAQEKNIVLSSDIKPLTGYIDREKVEIIVFNLLSNAIKYTPENGHVNLSVTDSGDNCTIRVTDDGIGIPKDKRKNIFNRHERLDVDKEMPQIQGNGIGLNYAQALASTHKGMIEYSPNEGPGSTFSLTIPIKKACYEGSDIGMEFIKKGSSPVPGSIAHSPEKSTIAIAEDDEELLSYLNGILSSRFNIQSYNNGKDCLEGITKGIPDLIISDVMMPQMDGYTLCEKIRADQEICHVPIVLLTAKNDLQSSIQGVRAGADAYIGKPFDPEYLQAVINTLLENRKKLQNRILNLTPSTLGQGSKDEKKSLSKMDEAFLKKLHKAMDRHIGDESFSMEALASEINVSYSSLYNKVKALTGCSPLSFFTTYKMNIAKEMLQSGEYTIAEVADKMGASSPSNFSRDFRRHFGKMPKDYSFK
ncbi:MAG: response regulator [Bacteroidales bacterium]|nr:response regulator [Bacteroidales bacterium]